MVRFSQVCLEDNSGLCNWSAHSYVLIDFCFMGNLFCNGSKDWSIISLSWVLNELQKWAQISSSSHK